MQNAAGDNVARAPHDRNDVYRAVVSALVSLVEHVQKSLRLIEQTIARETLPGSPESSANIIVLDDVSARYMKAGAALHACDVASPCAGFRRWRSLFPKPAGAFGHRGVRPTRRCSAGAYDVSSPQIFPGFSRAVSHLLRSRAGVRHATGAPPQIPPRRWRSSTQRSTNSAQQYEPRHFLDANRSSLRWKTLQLVCATPVHSAPRCDRPQRVASSAFDVAPDRFLACLPLRKRMSISVPLTRTSSHRR